MNIEQCDDAPPAPNPDDAPLPSAVLCVVPTPCAICLSHRKPKTHALLPCGHTFHRRCINKWVTNTPTRPLLCPVCRAHVDTWVRVYL
jgi:hypothetical protein